MRLTLRAKLGLSFGAVIITVAISGYAIFQSVGVIQQAQKWNTHTLTVIEKASNLVQSMVDQETGLRGYLLSSATGNPNESFLEPYTQGRETFAEHLAEVAELTSDNPIQQGNLEELEALQTQWTRDVAERAISLTRRGSAEGHDLEVSGAGKQAMDGIRAKTAEMIGIEQALLTERSEAMESAFATAYNAVIASVGGTIVLSLILCVTILIGLSRGLAQAIGLSQRVAGGDLTETAALRGNDEITDLLTSQNEMILKLRAIVTEVS
ncbi:methyl-accepting chemotaxis protein, partial [Rubellimicrobium rubrum]